MVHLNSKSSSCLTLIKEFVRIQFMDLGWFRSRLMV